MRSSTLIAQMQRPRNPPVEGRSLIMDVRCVFVLLQLLLLQFVPAMVQAQRRVTRGSVGTFNTFLFRGAPAFEERKDQLLETLQSPRENRSPDVLCLQELYRRSDAVDVVEAALPYYPYHASFDNLTPGIPPSAQPACTVVEVQSIGACALSRCAHVAGTLAFANCTLVECKDIVFRLSTSCRSCSGAEIGADPQTDSFTRCASVVPASEYLAPYGLLLLSRYELTNITTIDLLPDGPVTGLPRGYIKAKVEALSDTVVCTHLTPDNAAQDYVGPPQFATAAEQQADEIKALHDLVEGESRILLLGDFNHGPAIPGLTWKLPLNYGLMAARGVFSVNAMWWGPCTFCSQDLNPLTGLTESYIIDHIYLPNNRASAVLRFERLFHNIRTPSGLPLSDHFGVRADLYFHRGHRRTCRSCETYGRNDRFLDLVDIDFHVGQFCPL